MKIRTFLAESIAAAIKSIWTLKRCLLCIICFFGLCVGRCEAINYLETKYQSLIPQDAPTACNAKELSELDKSAACIRLHLTDENLAEVEKLLPKLRGVRALQIYSKCSNRGFVSCLRSTRINKLCILDLNLSKEDLSGFPNLRLVELSGSTVSQELLESMPKKSLEELILYDVKVAKLGNRNLSLLCFPSLRILGLEKQTCSYELLSHLPKHLLELDLSGSSVPDGLLGLTHCSHLRKLTLLGVKLDARKDGPAINKLVHLQFLYLPHGFAIDQWLEEISRLSKLQELPILIGKFSEATGDLLARFPNLRELDLRHVNLPPTFFRKIGNFQNLRSLFLDNKFDCRAEIDWAKITKLQNLSVCHTNADDLVVTKLIALPQLRYLDLSDTQISSKALLSLGKLHRLAGLDLSANEGICENLDGLRLAKLTSLNLRNCRVTNSQVSQITYLPSLSTLNLAENPLTDACLEDLCKLRALKSLEISTTGISEGGLCVLRKCHKHALIYTSNSYQDIARRNSNYRGNIK